MMHSCELCGNDFLTEADPYIVRPTQQGVKLYCYCMIKGFDEMKGAEKLKEENKKLIEALKFYVDTNNWDAADGVHDSVISGVITGADHYEPWGEAGIAVGGKLARQVLKEIGEE